MIKKYEKYKESGIEGVKNVPIHWNPIKLKFIGTLYSGLTGKKGDDFYDEENPKSRPYVNFKNIANNIKINPNEFDLVAIEENETQNQVKKNDLFFLMSSENFEDIGKTSVLIDDLNETYLNSFCRGFRIYDDNFNPVFLNYLLLSNDYRQKLSNEAKGFTRINIQVGKINNFEIYAPFNKSEQTQIANFLDHQTAIIDDLIGQKEKLIALLKEKRQAIINEAVTKGLYPNAKMKDSGIEWLGQVPEEWKVLNFRYVINILTDFTANGSFADLAKNVTYLESGYSRLVRLTDLRENLDNVGIYVSEQTHNYLAKSVLYGDEVLLANVGAYAGLACKVPSLNAPATLGPNMLLLKFKEELNNDYAFLSLNSEYLSSQLKNKAVSSAQPKLNKEDVRSCFFILPPIEEQIEIINRLNEINKNFFEIIDDANIQITKLKEYRQSLTSEAVTGKIDVREWVDIQT